MTLAPSIGRCGLAMPTPQRFLKYKEITASA